MEKTINIGAGKSLLKIKTASKYFAGVVDAFITHPYLDITPGRNKQKPYAVTLTLSLLPKDSRAGIVVNQNRCASAVFLNRSRTEFLVRTVNGSFVKTDLRKGNAEGRISLGDKYSLFLLKKWVYSYLSLSLSVRLHSALIKKAGGKAIFFAGNSGTGKSTLSDMLNDLKGFSCVTDDECFLFSSRKSVCAFDVMDDIGDSVFPLVSPVIFFLIRREEAPRVIPISKKEAFKRLCFLSEFPVDENEDKTNRRMDTLDCLVKRCKCSLLINGSGLKGNRKKLKKLVLS